MRFEEKKFCSISTLAARWECSPRSIYRLVESGKLEAWHPSGLPGKVGLKITVSSVTTLEQAGKISSDAYFL